MVISAQFDEAIEFSEGLARVKIEGKYGFIDRKAVVRISPRLDRATHFIGGAALAWMDGYQGYINLSGEFISRWPESLTSN